MQKSLKYGLSCRPNRAKVTPQTTFIPVSTKLPINEAANSGFLQRDRQQLPKTFQLPEIVHKKKACFPEKGQAFTRENQLRQVSRKANPLSAQALCSAL